MSTTDSRKPVPSGEKGPWAEESKRISPIESLQNMQTQCDPQTEGKAPILISTYADWVGQVKEASPDGGVALVCQFAEDEGLDPNLLHQCILEHISYFGPKKGSKASNRDSSGNESEGKRPDKVVPAGVSDSEFNTLKSEYLDNLIKVAKGGKKGETPKLPVGFNQRQVESLLGIVSKDLSLHNSYAQTYKASEEALRGRAKGYKALNSRIRMDSLNSKSEGDSPADPTPNKSVKA